MTAALTKPARKILPTHVHQGNPVNLSKEARTAMGPYVERQRAEHEAHPPQDDLFERPVYRTGDGDPHPYVPRPGSLRAFTLPSRGLSV